MHDASMVRRPAPVLQSTTLQVSNILTKLQNVVACGMGDVEKAANDVGDVFQDAFDDPGSAFDSAEEWLDKNITEPVLESSTVKEVGDIFEEAFEDPGNAIDMAEDYLNKNLYQPVEDFFDKNFNWPDLTPDINFPEPPEAPVSGRPSTDELDAIYDRLAKSQSGAVDEVRAQPAQTRFRSRLGG